MLPRLFLAVFVFACLIGQAGADEKPPELQALQASAYPEPRGTYTIRLAGWNAFKSANSVKYAMQVPMLRLYSGTLLANCKAESKSHCVEQREDGDFLAIVLHDVAQESGEVSLVYKPILSGGSDLTVPLAVVVSPCSAMWPRLMALAITVVLLGLVSAVISLRGCVRLASGQSVNKLRAFLINKATSSYSLANLQLYVWMIAAFSAYIYLITAKYMTQGDLEFVDIPQNIAGLSLISVSTSVLSSGINSTSGGGGSGAFGPNPSDLVSSGGDVAPERVQQLLWTLLGAPLFVLLVYRSDPATIDTVQGIPSSFLQIMGVSSVGYLGGKIARGSGPKIAAIAATMDNGASPFVKLVVFGSDIQTQGATYYLTDLSVPGSSPVSLPGKLDGTSKVDANGVATELDMTLPSPFRNQPAPGAKWLLRFTIRAADGEVAEWEF